ncbi:MAG: hypothetical protein EBS29_13030, partial [Chloroflexia bacterium]|nr:hypothetical protein [Chloroflexia bacterium]
QRAWTNMSSSLRLQAANMTDAYSQRSMLLRSVVYGFVGVGLTLPSDKYADEFAQATKVCVFLIVLPIAYVFENAGVYGCCPAV